MAAGVIRHAPWAEAPGAFAIALRPIAEADWFEGGEEAEAIAARKTALRASAGPLVWAETAGSKAAQAEAWSRVSAWAAQSPFPLDGGRRPRGAGSDGGDLSAPAGAGRRPTAAASPSSSVSAERSPPSGASRHLPPSRGKEDLWRASLLVSDDLCLIERVDGAWTLTALSLCAGSLFNATEVIGRSLARLHAPVPGFAERLLARVERIFDRLPDDQVLMRRNWSVTPSDALSLPHVGPVRALAAAVTPETAGDTLHLRVERQTLRRLPRTGALLFTIRVWLDPLAALSADQRAVFAEAWRGAAPDFRSYKGLPALDAAVEGWLASQANAFA